MLPNPEHVHAENSGGTASKQLRPDQLRYLFSTVLIVLGVLVLLTQIVPLGLSLLNGWMLSHNAQAAYRPLPDNMMGELLKPQYYDPGISYFANLLAQNNMTVQAGGQTLGAQSEAITIDTEYDEYMQVSVPRSDILDINVTPNVESFNKDVYEKALKHGVAHFRGTPIPGDGGNSFIYGHSGVANFWQINKPQLIFSKLESVQIGDPVEVKKEGNTLQYTVIKKIIINESELQVLETVPGKETVTLMTCWPLGIGTQRLVVVAERHE